MRSNMRTKASRDMPYYHHRLREKTRAVFVNYVVLFLGLTTWDGGRLIHVNGDVDAFTYFRKDSDLGRGYEDWDEVSQDYQYFPWDKFLRDQGSNECRDHESSSSSGHRQSPIDIRGADDCNEADNPDDHRHWTIPGECTVDQVSWTIEPWGLLMTFPHPTDDSNVHPKDYICEHPTMDSSGYGDPFYANYVSVVSPSEHTIEGEQFDAEINISHFHESRKYPMIFSVLARAKPEYPDNIILEQYLREWDRVHAKTREECENIFRLQNMSHCPVTSNQLSIGKEDFEKDTGTRRDSKGYMFDLRAASENDLAINAFDLNVRNTNGNLKHKFSVYVRDNFVDTRGTHVGYETGQENMWTQIASNIEIYGHGRDDPSRLTLSQPYLLRQGETIGFYIFHENDNDFMNADVDAKRTGDVQESDNALTLLVGTVVGDRNDGTSTPPFVGNLYRNRGLAGNVYYHQCNLDPSIDSYRISAQITSKDTEETAGLTLPQSVAQLSSDGFDFVGCFRKGGKDLKRVGTQITIPECSNYCRESGFKLFITRENGECFCTDGEFGYEGQTDSCQCDYQQSNPWTVGGSSKQCAFRVKRKYLGCFRIRRRSNAFEVRMTHTSTGLSLPKCQEACYDAGYRFMGLRHKGMCYCGNEPNYDIHGETSGCDCEGTNVGNWKFCAYDLGAGLPDPVYIKDNPLYSKDRYEYLGCYRDTRDRGLPIFAGKDISEEECAARCFEQNHRYFSRQYERECYCGDGMYARHGKVSDDQCKCDSTTTIGTWRMCVYEYTKQPEQAASFIINADGGLFDKDSTAKSAASAAPIFQPMQSIEDVRDQDWGPFVYKRHPYLDVYRLLSSPWYYLYRGSYTKPMCNDSTRWRIFKEPMQISMRQKQWIDLLIKEMRYPKDSVKHTCEKGTVGRPRFEFDPTKATDHVDVNRPTQSKNSNRRLYFCDSKHWKSQGFYMTPRANTYWNLMEEKNLFTPVDHFNN